MGTFIVIEGIDGAGKSTQINNIVDILSEKFPDKKIILTREPGGTNNPLGEQIRDILLNNKMDDYTRTLLYAASRFEHQQRIKEWLNNDYIVICDRYIYSSMAYQTDLNSNLTHQFDSIMNINRYDEIAIPDYIFHFDISFDTYLKRKATRLNERDLDELEKKGDSFFKKNIEMYDKTYNHIIEMDDIYSVFNINTPIPTIIKIDANKSINDIKNQLQYEIDEIFN